MNRPWTVRFASLLLTFLACWAASGAQRAPVPVGLTGRVVSDDGKPLSGATVIACGGFSNWVETAVDGTFELKTRVTFLSVRHRRFKPVLLAVDGGQRHLEIRMAPVDKSVWRLPKCRTEIGGKRPFIGGRLKVRIPGDRYRGPVHGQHDAHWYIDFNKGESLHIASGPNSHAGLPLESWLADSTTLEHRGWVCGDKHGLDISGVTPDGKKWRWVGAMVQDAVSYNNVSKEASVLLDSVIDTVCLGY